MVDTSMVLTRLNVKICNVMHRKSCTHEVPKGIEVKPELAEL
jgi:hypothetical protein